MQGASRAGFTKLNYSVSFLYRLVLLAIFVIIPQSIRHGIWCILGGTRLPSKTIDFTNLSCLSPRMSPDLAVDVKNGGSSGEFSQ
jgi:hypothetical protein